jgi:hypothetical protein
MPTVLFLSFSVQSVTTVIGIALYIDERNLMAQQFNAHPFPGRTRGNPVSYPPRGLQFPSGPRNSSAQFTRSPEFYYAGLADNTPLVTTEVLGVPDAVLQRTPPIERY